MPVNVTSPWIGRSLFLVCLLAVAVGLGVSAFFVTSIEEERHSDRQFDVLAAQALGGFASYVERKQFSLVTMASVAGELQPDPKRWPFVALPNFQTIATQLLRSTSGRDMGFVPFVQPNQREEWMNFAYTWYNTTRVPEAFPPGTGVTPFGIYGMKNGTRFASVNGTYPGTNITLLTPVFQIDDGINRAMLFDHRSETRRRRAVDGMISCAEAFPEMHCTGLTQAVKLLKFEKEGPASIMYQFIRPRSSASPTGFIVSPLVWIDILREGFSLYEIDGLEVFLTMKTEVGESHFQYSMQKGEAIYRGQAQKTPDNDQGYRHSSKLTMDNAFAPGSPEYLISIYPNDEFADTYQTNVPLLATLVAAFAVLLTALFFFMYDFCVRKHVQEQKALLEAKRNFMRFVSHEVRTPINSITLGVQVLQEEIAKSLGFTSVDHLSNKLTQESPQNGEQEPSICNTEISGKQAMQWFALTRDVVSSSQVANDVLSDFLDFDKIQSGSFQLEWTQVCLYDILLRTINEFKLPANAKGIVFRTSLVQDIALEGGLPWSSEFGDMTVVGDPARLTQVFRNLFSNALKFSPQDSTVEIHGEWRNLSTEERHDFILMSGGTLTLQKTGDVTIAVADHGAGMTKHQLENAFCAGVQFDVNKLQAGKGSGLGLHISRGIVDQHGGTLTAESKGIGDGSTFTMTLPLFRKTKQLEREAAITLDTESTETLSGFGSLRVLVVDDSDMNRKLLSRLLKKRGHEVQQAVDGEEAVAKVQKALEHGTPFDSILLDYDMPNMNGPDAAKAMRALGCNAFVAGVTGNVFEEDIEYFISCGADTVLGKPLDLAKLQQLWIQNRLGQHEAEGTLEESTV